MKILCLGHATYDITLPLENFVKENTKTRVCNKVECGGGPAATAAYLLGKWGCDVYFAGLVGNDFYGLKVKQELNKVNVNTKYLELNSNINTDISYILANKSNGSRTILTVSQKKQMADFDLNFAPDTILIDGQEYEMSKKILNMYPDSLSIIDAGRNTDKIIELCKMVKWVVCSKDFAESVTNISNNISLIYNKLKLLFNCEVIITLGDKGCYYKNEIINTIKLEALDSTGAGDIFHGALVYYLSNGYDPINAIKLANYAGAISVTKLGTRNSIPTKEEMEVFYNEFK